MSDLDLGLIMLAIGVLGVAHTPAGIGRLEAVLILAVSVPLACRGTWLIVRTLL